MENLAQREDVGVYASKYKRACVSVCLHVFMPLCNLQAVKLITIEKTAGQKALYERDRRTFAAINLTTSDFP